MMRQRTRGGPLSLSRVRTAFPVAVTTFFFTILNIQITSLVLPMLIVMMAGLCSLIYHRQLLRCFADLKVIAIFPLLVLLSSFWSDVPTTSLWYGMQLVITILAGILIGSCATSREIVRGIYYAMVIVTVASLISGEKGPSAVGPVLIGVTGSKDAMGFVGLTLFAAALSLGVDREQPKWSRLSTLVFLPVGAAIATGVEALTTALAIFAVAIVFSGLMTLKRLEINLRWVLLGLGATAALCAIIGVMLSGLSIDSVLLALNKDTTLTGRTTLWASADEWIDKAPILGHGYKAFWLGGSNESLSLLAMFGLTDGRVFQFHNTYREIMVDLGGAGLLALLAAGVPFIYCSLINAFYYPSSPNAFFATILILLAARSPVESIVLVFYPYTVLFYACGVAAALTWLSRKRRPAISRSPMPSMAPASVAR
jgi:exopolysaccharide production protein ExoQ